MCWRRLEEVRANSRWSVGDIKIDQRREKMMLGIEIVKMEIMGVLLQGI